MRQSTAVKRYGLARTGIVKPRPEEGIKRLRLVRMEEIAELDRPAPPPARKESQ